MISAGTFPFSSPSLPCPLSLHLFRTVSLPHSHLSPRHFHSPSSLPARCCFLSSFIRRRHLPPPPPPPLYLGEEVEPVWWRGERLCHTCLLMSSCSACHRLWQSQNGRHISHCWALICLVREWLVWWLHGGIILCRKKKRKTKKEQKLGTEEMMQRAAFGEKSSILVFTVAQNWDSKTCGCAGILRGLKYRPVWWPPRFHPLFVWVNIHLEAFHSPFSPPGQEIFDVRVLPLPWRMINISVLNRSLTGIVIETEAVCLSQVIFVLQVDDQ